MASDEIIWQIINEQMCSFKLKTSKEQTFCRNEYNVTGLCGRQTCPLANSRYATIRSDPADPAKLFLYTKTIERAHLPSKMWERTKLPGNYAKALDLLDSQLAYWPKYLVHKCKQRLTRLTQVALRMRRLAKEEARLGENLVPKPAPKVKRREEARERKAEGAARVERAIERELIERLRSGAYGDKPLNVEEGMWQKVLRGLERAGEGARDRYPEEDVVETEEEEEAEMEEEEVLDGEYGAVEYVSDIEGESDDEARDVEDWDGSGSAGSGLEEYTLGSDEGTEDADQEEDAKLQKALAGQKRKRPLLTLPKMKKQGGGSKGPEREIEYEIEGDVQDTVH